MSSSLVIDTLETDTASDGILLTLQLARYKNCCGGGLVDYLPFMLNTMLVDCYHSVSVGRNCLVTLLSSHWLAGDADADW